jgi:hypothetical protein
MKWLLLATLCAGCFPYRETYRPEFDGLVVNAAGAPAAGVRVESCSATHWDSRCRYRANTTSGADGRFHFTKKVEWDWCCLGEAPMPYTIVAACGPDGRVASSRVYGKGPPEPVRMMLAAPPPGEEWARRACAQ